MNYFKIPALIRWTFSVSMVFLLAMTVMRVIFYFMFPPGAGSFSNHLDAFLLGLRYDLRMACIVVLPVFLIGCLRLKYKGRRLAGGSIARLIVSLLFMVTLILFMKNNKFGLLAISLTAALYLVILFWLFKAKDLDAMMSKTSKKVWLIYLTLAALLFAVLYTADLQNYDYLHQRLNASVLGYTQDAAISMKVVWQSYPIIKMILGLIIFVTLVSWAADKIYERIRRTAKPVSANHSFFISIVYFILMAIAIFGSVSQYPLRWSNAYTLGSDYKANLALNPIQSFFSSLRFKNSGYKIENVRANYNLMAKYLGITERDSSRLNFTRVIPASQNSSRHPNVIVVLCESFSGYKSSMWGNPLNTTPYFNSLAKQGAFFNRCFTPAYGTARGVWATVTGIPDVEPAPGTASRNPAAVDQHTIINDFAGYEKYYFLGGSTSWANIRGLLTNNIEGLHLYEEGSFKSPAIDVWGISDKQLFMEANEVMKKETKPFFAMIQTAGNHRPYTIPEEDRSEFKTVEIAEDTLHKYGFETNRELNAFRYTDFCFRKFMEAAAKEKYFSNTVFVFIGDHGIRGSAGQMFPRTYTDAGLTTQHIPLLFYSPSFVAPAVYDRIASQVDVLPSVAGIAGIAYRNTTMGRDLFAKSDSTLDYTQNAFLFDPDKQLTGMITTDYCYIRQGNPKKEDLLPIRNNEPVQDSARQINLPKLGQLTAAWMETAKYLMLNNKKSAPRRD